MSNMCLLSVLLAFLIAFNEAQAQNTTGSCHSFTSCCDPTVSTSCIGDGGGCYCDQICYQFNDCCQDIGANCLAASNEPTADNGHCVGQGFDGCCNPNLQDSCKGSDDNALSPCFCDQVCYQYGDCCNDISQIGCFVDASSPTATATSGSCVAAGFESCCNPSDSSDCHGNPPSCYCDLVCYEFDDCCTDISTVCGTSVTPTADKGSCAGLGFTTGCCVQTADENCHGNDEICYCDEVCYNSGDCCEDIEEINCYNDQPTGDQGSCVQQGFEGCCDPSISSECFGSAGISCYCDELCFQFNDCCSDVDDIGCIEPTGNPVKNNGSCLLNGYSSCCSPGPFELCVGDDGTCFCDAQCYEYGDCCKDIDFLLCTKPTDPAQGSCQAAGYTNCCHPYNQNGTSCYGSTQTCYCDSVCYSFGDCCDDISSIGCVAPTNIVPNQGSCAAAGYTKCCTPTDTDQCFGHPETCHCDVICHEFGDCCEDVIDIGCNAATGTCAAAGHTSCCLSDDPDCSGIPANCMCDQGCFLRGDCCNDVVKLSNCYIKPDTVPTAVNNLNVSSVSDTSLNISWMIPDTPNGANIYTAVIKNYTHEGYKPWIRSISIYSTHYIIDGLSPYKPYNVTVFASNEFGHGKRKQKNAFTKEGIPNVAPHNVDAVRSGQTTLTVTWTPLNLTEAKSFLTGYLITYSTISRRRRSTDEKTKFVANRWANSVVLTGLDADKRYGVSIAGVSKQGNGISSKITYEGGTTTSKSPRNYGAIIGIAFGVFGILLVTMAVVFVIVLILWKRKGKSSGASIQGRKFTRLLVNANDDDDSDDDEMVD